MIRSRRAVLGGLAAGIAVSPLRAISISPTAWGNFGIEIEAARLTQGGWLKGRLTAPELFTALRLGAVDVLPDAAGRFFVGFDRDAPDIAYLTGSCRTAGACTLKHDPPQFGLAITPRQWQIERVNAAFHPPAMPDADFARIRKDELAQIGAARAQNSDSLGWKQSFAWPLTGPLRGRFGSQRIFRGTPAAYHPGLDIAGAQGAPYVAPADGLVTLAAATPFTLEGNLLVVDHGMGLSSAFLHSSRLAVKVGDRVQQGQLLGWVGKTGRATGPHLHWALKWREARLDPLLFVALVH